MIIGIIIYKILTLNQTQAFKHSIIINKIVKINKEYKIKKKERLKMKTKKIKRKIR